MRGIRNYSLPPQCRFRGHMALGFCGIITCFCLSVLPVGATELETTIIEPQEMEEELLDNDIDDAGAIVDSVSDSDSISEIGPDTTEGEMESEIITIGCTCGEEIITYFESQVNEPVMYQTPEEVENTPALLSRYEYEVIKRLEFLQYAGLILIGLIFILIFKKK